MPQMWILANVFVRIVAALIAVLSLWLGYRWGMAHLTFQAPYVPSCHTKTPDYLKCLLDSREAVYWHNYVPVAWRIAIVAGAGLYLSKRLIRFGDSFFGYRW